jgi:hypothetical protein
VEEGVEDQLKILERWQEVEEGLAIEVEVVVPIELGSVEETVRKRSYYSLLGERWLMERR